MVEILYPPEASSPFSIWVLITTIIAFPIFLYVIRYTIDGIHKKFEAKIDRQKEKESYELLKKSAADLFKQEKYTSEALAETLGKIKKIYLMIPPRKLTSLRIEPRPQKICKMTRKKKLRRRMRSTIF